MKKLFLCLMAVCLLSACDFTNSPKCWDTEIEKELAESTWTITNNDVYSNNFNQKTTYKAKKVIEIVEVPDINKKYDRLCNAQISYEDGSVHGIVYVPYWAISKNSKRVKYETVGEF